MDSKFFYPIIATIFRILATIILSVGIFFLIWIALATGSGPWWKIILFTGFKLLLMLIIFFLLWVIDRVWQGKFIGMEKNFWLIFEKTKVN